MPRVATTSRKPARASTSRSTSRPRRDAFAQVRAAADPVTAYAKAVKRGAIVAGPHVRAACDRHLRDLVHGAQRGLRWDIASVQRVVGYFRDVLRLNGGQWEGLPYELLGWQLFVVGSLYGWQRFDARGKRLTVANVAIARELACFLWAAAVAELVVPVTGSSGTYTSRSPLLRPSHGSSWPSPSAIAMSTP